MGKQEVSEQARAAVTAWLSRIQSEGSYRLINRGGATPSKDYMLEVTNTTDADLRQLRVDIEIYKDDVKVDCVTAKTSASGIRSGETGQLAFFTKEVNFSALKILPETAAFKTDLIPKVVMETQQQDQSRFGHRKPVSEEFRAETGGMLRDKQSEYIRDLSGLRDQAGDDEIKSGLDALIPVIDKIFARAEEVSGSEAEVKRLTDRYLPMIINSTRSYLTYSRKNITGEDMDELRGEVISGIKLVTEACSNLLARLYEDGIVDASTDISVLKMMLKQDGLLGSDILK